MIDPSTIQKADVYKIIKYFIKELVKVNHSTFEERKAVRNEIRQELRETLNMVREMYDEMETYDFSIEGEPRHGSLLLSFRYRSVKALQSMWKMYLNGELLRILQSGLITNYVLIKSGAKSVQLALYIPDYVEHLKGNRNILISG